MKYLVERLGQYIVGKLTLSKKHMEKIVLRIQKK